MPFFGLIIRMETKIDISNELNSLSPLIAAMEKLNVFTVPQGYFETIIDTVLSCLREENRIELPAANEDIIGVPAGYFDGLANSILEKIKSAATAKAETKGLSPLLHSLQSKNVFEVPNGYFDDIPTRLFNKLTSASEELQKASPLLYSLKSKHTFEAPEEYFAHFPEGILRKINPPAKVVSMTKRTFVKYAAAAMLTAAAALGLYNYFGKPANDNTSSLAVLDASIIKGKSMNEQQFNESIQRLSDADIAKYLELNGDIADVTLLKNNLEDVSLPSQEDYLLDGATLDKYLKSIEKTTANN